MMKVGWTPRRAVLTVLHVEGVRGESQRGAAVVALEAAAMEELALRTQPLHHVHALAAEETDVAAPDVHGKLLPQGALRVRGDWMRIWEEGG